jgi:hypothetical protein
LIKKYIGQIKWVFVSQNPSAIDILEANQNKVCNIAIWENSAIFEPEADHYALLMQVKF